MSESAPREKRSVRQEAVTTEELQRLILDAGRAALESTRESLRRCAPNRSSLPTDPESDLEPDPEPVDED